MHVDLHMKDTITYTCLLYDCIVCLDAFPGAGVRALSQHPDLMQHAPQVQSYYTDFVDVS